MKRLIDAHAPYRDLIAAHLDRPLTRSELRSLTGHLKTCHACRALDSDYRAQRQRLRALPAPIPPRDLWARTSAALDREIVRGTRSRPYESGYQRRGRAPGPLGALLTAVVAVSTVAALAVMQIGPVFQPASTVPPGATPFSVAPQALAFIGSGAADIAIYRTQVNRVCPASSPDCVTNEGIERTPVGLPPNMRARNLALSPSGKRLALVGSYVDEDVIAVVFFGDDDPPGGTTTTPPPTATAPPTEQTGTPDPSTSQPPEETPPVPPTSPASTPPAGSPPAGSPDVSATVEPIVPSLPPPSALPGLRVLSILENVDSAGAPPAWSPDGEMLAFSAMPADGSHGPDVYVWSPTDQQARALTTDHASYFASWSDAGIVASRVFVAEDSGLTFATILLDPLTLVERQLGGPAVWLPIVNPQGTLAVVWHGTLELVDGLVTPRVGALYLTDWAVMSTAPPTITPSNDVALPESFAALDPQRDPASAPVVDWQVRWSSDGQILGVWIADSAGSSLGRLVVVAVDALTDQVSSDPELLAPTLARRGFSLGLSRVAWVAPTDANPDGELRIRTWGSDGVGGLRLQPSQIEEFVPAF